ncbi:hypothetical protein SAMN05216420_10251 [Nitrosospira sp. Nl5]|nr:hypothetical protein SAMN05216420_10251 [Nitrosospira sp. Nl5]
MRFSGNNAVFPETSWRRSLPPKFILILALYYKEYNKDSLLGGARNHEKNPFLKTGWAARSVVNINLCSGAHQVEQFQQIIVTHADAADGT